GVARLEGPAGAGALPARAGEVLDERRVLLWRDAAAIAHRHPIDGSGPGSFAALSPTARRDADARWAHSGFLQQGAEAGAVGMALLLAAFGWGFSRLWQAGMQGAFPALGALALAALGLHASLDYVLHFPAVPLVASALVGAATAPAAPRPAAALPP
ncbi:MAG: O-antigen ligase family protein, partial [Acidimicrobiales bacterium]